MSVSPRISWASLTPYPRSPVATNEIADSLERNWDNGDEFVKELQARDDADVACYAGGLAQEHSESSQPFHLVATF